MGWERGKVALEAFSVGDSATYLYINEVLISPAKVAVIARGHLTVFVFDVILF